MFHGRREDPRKTDDDKKGTTSIYMGCDKCVRGKKGRYES